MPKLNNDLAGTYLTISEKSKSFLFNPSAQPSDPVAEVCSMTSGSLIKIQKIGCNEYLYQSWSVTPGSSPLNPPSYTIRIQGNGFLKDGVLEVITAIDTEVSSAFLGSTDVQGYVTLLITKKDGKLLVHANGTVIAEDDANVSPLAYKPNASFTTTIVAVPECH